MVAASEGGGLVGGGSRIGVRACAEGAEHPQQLDPATLGAALADLGDESLGTGGPAGAHGRFAVGGTGHREPERALHRPRRVLGLLPATEGSLQRLDRLVMASEQLRGGGQVLELGGCERLGARGGPARQRRRPVTAVERGTRLLEPDDVHHGNLQQ